MNSIEIDWTIWERSSTVLLLFFIYFAQYCQVKSNLIARFATDKCPCKQCYNFGCSECNFNRCCHFREIFRGADIFFIFFVLCYLVKSKLKARFTTNKCPCRQRYNFGYSEFNFNRCCHFREIFSSAAIFYLFCFVLPTEE